MPPPDPSADQARAAIQAALGQIGFTLPGTITIRHARCGKPRCACAADPPSLHGPWGAPSLPDSPSIRMDNLER